MVRNIVLALSSLAFLIILFVGYTWFTGDVGGAPSTSAIDELPQQLPPTTEPMRLGQDLELPAGGEILFRIFDRHTGRPTELFRCQNWQRAGSENEILVTKPELSLLLPSGMIATISGDEGQLAVDRVERTQMKPKLGSLTGNVTIVVDRATAVQRTPAAERPWDLITIEMQRLDFDLDRSELRTDGDVAVRSDDFEIAGGGLHLIWNPADNRVETLTIERGNQFVLAAPVALFGAARPGERPATDSAPVATAPAVAQRPLRRRTGIQRRATAYECTLSGGIVAEQYQDDQQLGALTADEVRLLFDVGAGAGRLLRPSATSTPASRPARDQSNRLVVRWEGSLRLSPVLAAAEDELPRRHFIAAGAPVVLTQGIRAVQCAKLEYHEETERIWLYAPPGETIDFALGENLSATAASVYVDQPARIVKLIGDVALRAQRGKDATAAGSSIRSSYWAELHLAEAPATAPSAATTQSGTTTQPGAAGVELVNFDRLESATFVGDVQVDLGKQQLTAHRLDVGFRAGDAEAFEQHLEMATASGGVQLTDGDGTLSCGELRLAFATTPEGGLFPRQMTALGAAHLIRRRASIRGDQIAASLDAPEGERKPRGPAFVLRTLEITGRAELVDPDNKVAARGRQITGLFVGDNRLTSAAILGTPQRHGVLRVEPYTVGGARIDLDRDAQTVQVDGPSRLSFRARRSLQGDVRRQPTPVVVTSRDRLRVALRGNAVSFAGDVLARSGDERLAAQAMTLELEDVPEPTTPPRPKSVWHALWQQLRPLAALRPGRAPRESTLAWGVDRSEERIRKEPLRLTAEYATLASETFAPPDPKPLVHASIAAPALTVDIVNRQIVTTGDTVLGLIDRRGMADTEATGNAIGVPSGLLSRGPSQTAMRCAGRMTYTLGPEGPDRRDTAVFEDQVLFLHCTGKEMDNLTYMLPQVAQQPELIEALKSRLVKLECRRLESWFAAGDAGTSLARAGGAFTRSPLKLSSLLASGDVYLRDREDSRIREVDAAWIEFNRDEGRITVRGTDTVDARVYSEDPQTGQFGVIAGRQLVVNLKDGTVRSEQIAGEMRRE